MTVGAAEIIGLVALLLTFIGGGWGVVAFLLTRIERQRREIEEQIGAAEARINTLEHGQKAYMDRAEVLQHFKRVEDGVQRVHERMDRFMEAAAGRSDR